MPRSQAGVERGLVVAAASAFDNGMAKLSRTIVTILLAGRHRAVGGRILRERAANLARIAKAYSRAELEAERGLGPARATEVEHWLSGQGLSLRLEQEHSASAVAGAAAARVGFAEKAPGSEV